MTRSVRRVLHIIGPDAADAAPGVARLAGLLAERGDQVVVAGPRRLLGSLSLPEGVRTWTLPLTAHTNPPADLAATLRIRTAAAGADVVHAHGLRAGAMAAVARLAAPGRAPLLVTVSGDPADHDLLGDVVARDADLVLAPDAEAAAAFEARGARRTGVTREPADPVAPPRRTRRAVRRALEVPPGAWLVVSALRCDAESGLPALIEAAEWLTGHLPGRRVHWVVAGDGPLRQQAQLAALRRELPVTMLGRRRDLSDLVAAADLVAQPGAGPAVHLARALGVPVVAPVQADGVLPVPPRDAGALARAVARLVADPVLRGRLGVRGREGAGAQWTADDAAARIAALYDDLVLARDLPAELLGGSPAASDQARRGDRPAFNGAPMSLGELMAGTTGRTARGAAGRQGAAGAVEPSHRAAELVG